MMKMIPSLALHAVEGLAFLAERGAAPAELTARACLLFARPDGSVTPPVAKVRAPCLRRFADRTAAVAGPDAYVAPERAVGEGGEGGGEVEGPDAAASADVYSFGVLLNAMLRRERPYAHLVRQGRHTLHELPRLVFGGVRPLVAMGAAPRAQALVRRCFEAKPEKRPEWQWVLAELRALACVDTIAGAEAAREAPAPLQRAGGAQDAQDEEADDAQAADARGPALSNAGQRPSDAARGCAAAAELEEGPPPPLSSACFKASGADAAPPKAGAPPREARLADLGKPGASNARAVRTAKPEHMAPESGTEEPRAAESGLSLRKSKKAKKRGASSRQLQSSLRGKTMMRAARERNALHREATFRLDDGESGPNAGAEAGAGEAFALPRVSEERPSDAPGEATDPTAELANRIIAAAELDDAEAMEELSATARRMIAAQEESRPAASATEFLFMKKEERSSDGRR